jgi:hypothetical protein
VIRMTLENGHYIHNALEGLEPQNCGNLHLTLRWYCLVVAIHRSRFQTATPIGRPGLDKPHRVLDDHAARPGVCPFPKNLVASGFYQWVAPRPGMPAMAT